MASIRIFLHQKSYSEADSEPEGPPQVARTPTPTFTISSGNTSGGAPYYDIHILPDTPPATPLPPPTPKPVTTTPPVDNPPAPTPSSLPQEKMSVIPAAVTNLFTPSRPTSPAPQTSPPQEDNSAEQAADVYDDACCFLDETASRTASPAPPNVVLKDGEVGDVSQQQAPVIYVEDEEELRKEKKEEAARHKDENKKIAEREEKYEEIRKEQEKEEKEAAKKAKKEQKEKEKEQKERDKRHREDRETEPSKDNDPDTKQSSRKSSAPGVDVGASSYDPDQKRKSKLPWKKGHHDKGKHHDKTEEERARHKEFKDAEKRQKKHNKEWAKEEKEIEKEQKKENKEEVKELKQEHKEQEKEGKEISKDQKQFAKELQEEEKAQHRAGSPILAQAQVSGHSRESSKEDPEMKKLRKHQEKLDKEVEKEKAIEKEIKETEKELNQTEEGDKEIKKELEKEEKALRKQRKKVEKELRKKQKAEQDLNAALVNPKGSRHSKENSAISEKKAPRSDTNNLQPYQSNELRLSEPEARDRAYYDNQGFYLGVVDPRPTTPPAEAPKGSHWWYKKGTPPPAVGSANYDYGRDGSGKTASNSGSDPEKEKTGSDPKYAAPAAEESPKPGFHWFGLKNTPDGVKGKPANERLRSETLDSISTDGSGSDDPTTEADGRTSYATERTIRAHLAPELIPLPPSSAALVPVRMQTPDGHRGPAILVENRYPNGLQVPSRKLFTDGFHYPPGLETWGVTKKEWEDMVHSLNGHMNPHRTWWRALIVGLAFPPVGWFFAYPMKVWGEQHDFNASVEHIMRRVEDADAEIFRPKGLLLRLDKPGEVRGMAYMDMYHRHHIDRLPRAMLGKDKVMGVTGELGDGMGGGAWPQELRVAAKRAEEAEERSILLRELEGREVAREVGRHKAADGNKVARKARRKPRRRSVRHVLRARNRMAKRPRLVIESVGVLNDERGAERHGWGVWYRRLRRHHGDGEGEGVGGVVPVRGDKPMGTYR